MVVATPTFADRLRELREAAGLSQYQLAKDSGVAAQSISKYELGDTEPTYGTLKKLARALGVSLSAFDVVPAPEEPPAEPEPARPLGKRK